MKSFARTEQSETLTIDVGQGPQMHRVMLTHSLAADAGLVLTRQQELLLRVGLSAYTVARQAQSWMDVTVEAL